MRVGLVCPYSLDVPGGVQNHVVQLGEALLARGHEVSVLAPTGDDNGPDWVVGAGRAVPVPYNGSVARLTFGPRSMARTRRWLRDGDFDVVHVHEPTAPSLGLMALAAATGPVVATFHTAMERSRAMTASAGVLRPALEKLSARIAVSEPAAELVRANIGRDAVVIPNGIWFDRLTTTSARTDEPTVCFLGRFDEPRKGLEVLLEAMPEVWSQRPDVRLSVMGSGDADEALERVPPEHRGRVRFLGRVSDTERTAVLSAARAYVAPNLGGESFGIVLLEAMAAGTPVVASDLPAFTAVTEGGRYGVHFRAGDAEHLAEVVLKTLGDDSAVDVARDAAVMVRRFDWSVVTGQVVRVYETVAGTDGRG